jgi:hypothetical protein
MCNNIVITRRKITGLIITGGARMINELNGIFDLYMEKIRGFYGEKFAGFCETIDKKKQYWHSDGEFGIFWGGKDLRLDPPYCSVKVWEEEENGVTMIMIRWDLGSERQKVICPLSEWSPIRHYR